MKKIEPPINENGESSTEMIAKNVDLLDNGKQEDKMLEISTSDHSDIANPNKTMENSEKLKKGPIPRPRK